MTHSILPRLAGAFLTLATSSVHAATWVGAANDGDWTNSENWDTGAVPNSANGDSITIPAGTQVDYPAATLGDLKAENGGSIRIAGTLTQQTTHWTQINNGTLVIEGNGVFRRATGGNLVIGFTNASNSAVTISDSGALEVPGELWLGHNTNNADHIAALNIVGGGSVFTQGAVGLWIWDYDAPGSSMSINFSGPAGGQITVSDRIGIRPFGGEANNQADWRDLWNLGLLTAEGVSGLTGASFDDYFRTSGTPLADNQPYTLHYDPVPEPSSSVLSALALAALTRRGRKR